MLVDQRSSYRQITLEDYSAMAGPDWPDYQHFKDGCKIEQSIAIEIDSMLDSVEKEKSNLSNFCVLPFFGREYPENGHCCLLPSGYDIDEIRNDMLNNRRSRWCESCWVLEDSGNTSDRQLKNSTLDFYTNTDLVTLYKQAKSGDYDVMHYKISAGNYCNATCFTCDSISSTSWGKLESKNKNSKKLDLKIIKKDNEQIQINYHTATYISFMGGESTMIRTHWDIIEQLVAVGNTQCVISFVTNGSFELTQRQRDLLKKFQNVIFCFSIDGIGKVFEYMRFPLSWQKTLENIDWARKQGYKISSHYTISNLNVFYYEQTTNWFRENDIKYQQCLVTTPEYLTPFSLSHSVKQKILSNTENQSLKNWLSRHNDQDEKNFVLMLEEIKKQDELKQIKIYDYMPEFSDIIGIS